MHYNAVSFKNLIKDSNFLSERGLSLYHINAQSMRNKGEEIESELVHLNYDFDIMGFSETWFSSQSDVVSLGNYNMESVFRTGKRGGGVSLYIKQNLPYEAWPDYCVVCSDFEAVTVIHNKVVIVLIYRPPDGNTDSLLEFLEKLQHHANSNRWFVISFGDFNIDISKDGPIKLKLMELMLSHGCENIISTPTRITSTSETIIDLCFTNLSPDSALAGVFSSGISDHLPFFALLTMPELQNSPKYMRRDINDPNILRFRSLMFNCNWDDLYREPDPSKAYNLFMSKMVSNYNTAFPYVVVKKHKRARKEWITPALLKRINEKNKLFQHFLKTKEQTDLIEFKNFRNKVNKVLKKAKIDFYAYKFSTVINNSKMVWSSVNKLIGRKQATVPSYIQINDIHFSGKALADKFNLHFLEAGSSSNITQATDLKPAECYIESSSTNSLFLLPVTEEEVATVICSLKNSSPGEDGISAAPIKAVADLIVAPFTYICNRLFLTGIFPCAMKIARVTIIFKGGDKNELQNYRPISILPLFSKVAERLIYKRVFSFIANRNVICEEQCGFQPGRSTQSALLRIKDSLLHNFEKKFYTVGIFLDFRKAFDSIKHDILIRKLQLYGIRGIALDLMKSYLWARKQYVQLHNYKSDLGVIKYGVPQGSILGPLLFILYINDIVNIQFTPNIVMYADDTNAFFSGLDLRDIEITANSWLDKLKSWLTVNQLELNIKKTKFMLFKQKNRPVDYAISLIFNGENIAQVNKIQFLGVCFQSDLSWSHHVDNLRIKISRSIGLIRRLQHLLPGRVKRQLYFSFIYSQIIYCILVWGTCNKTNTESIILLQKRALGLISTSVPTNMSLFYMYNVLPFPECYRMQLAMLIFKKIKDNFQIFSDVYLSRDLTYNLRTVALVGPMCRTNYGVQSINNQIILLCNRIPEIIEYAKEAKNITQFKKRIYNVINRTQVYSVCKGNM